MEHNLGMTRDPIRRLVQIPCIERNAMGVKAINGCRMAMQEGGEQKGSLAKTSARQTVRSDRFDQGLCGTEEEALGYSCRRCSSSSKNARQKFLRVRLIEPLGNPRPRSISSRLGFLPTYRMSSSRPEIASGIEASLRPFQTTLRVLLCRRDPSGRSLS